MAASLASRVCSRCSRPLDAVLGAAHPLGGLDQGRIELGPVRLDGFDLGFEAPARLGIGRDRLFQDLQILLPPRLLLGRFALRRKARTAQAPAAGLRRGPGQAATIHAARPSDLAGR